LNNFQCQSAMPQLLHVVGRFFVPVYCHVRLGSCVGANPPFDAHAVYLELGAAGCFVQRYCLVLVLGKKYFLLQILLFVMRALYLC